MSDPVLAEATFLDRISRERNRRFSQPLILYGSDYENYDPVLDEPCVKYDNRFADKIVSNQMSKYDSDELSAQRCDKSRARVVPSLSGLCVREISMTDTCLPRGDIEPSSKWWRLHHTNTNKGQVTGVAQLITGNKNPKPRPQCLKEFVISLNRAFNSEGSVVRSLKVFEMNNLKSMTLENPGDIIIKTYTNECMVSITNGDKTRCHIKWFGWEESEGGAKVKSVHDILLKESGNPKKGAVTQVTLTVVRHERSSTDPEMVEDMITDNYTADTEIETASSEEMESTVNIVPTKLTDSPESNQGTTMATAITNTEDLDSMVEDSFPLLFGEVESGETEDEGDRSSAQPKM